MLRRHCSLKIRWNRLKFGKILLGPSQAKNIFYTFKGLQKKKKKGREEGKEN